MEKNAVACVDCPYCGRAFMCAIKKDGGSWATAKIKNSEVKR